MVLGHLNCKKLKIIRVSHSPSYDNIRLNYLDNIFKEMQQIQDKVELRNHRVSIAAIILDPDFFKKN